MTQMQTSARIPRSLRSLRNLRGINGGKKKRTKADTNAPQQQAQKKHADANNYDEEPEDSD
jgi:hypothetical protein